MAEPETRRAQRADHRATPRGITRVDASMSLLMDAMRDPLDPGYAQAARNPVRRSSRAAALTGLLALTAGLLVAAATVDLRPQALSGARDRARLQAEVTRRLEAAQKLRAGNARLRDEIARAQRAALAQGGGSALSDRLAALELASGELPVTGEGLRYTLRDAPSVQQTAVGQDPRENDDAAQGRVLDRDLQIVVNGLWAAGAEAIAVNGQRLTALSAIRSAGQAVLVDFRPLVPPYTIEAIGDPAGLQSRFADDVAGSYVQSLQDNYDIGVDVQTAQDLRLPGAGSLAVRLASPVPTTTPTPTSGTSSDTAPTTGPTASTDGGQTTEVRQ